jgi:hypothetical protein
VWGELLAPASACVFQPLAVTGPSGPLGTPLPVCGSAFFEPQSAPSGGPYTISVNPSSTWSGTIRLWLYDVVDYTGTITPNGASVTQVVTPGQVVNVTFDAVLELSRRLLKFSGGSVDDYATFSVSVTSPSC